MPVTMDMRSILANHASRYPSWSVEDLYKLIHQSAMGSEHARADEAAIEEWLTRELQQMGPGPEEPLLDPISPDGEILRVHLRPYVRHEFDRRSLLTAFLRTAREFHPRQDRLEMYVEDAFAVARSGALRVLQGDILRFFGEMKEQDYPAVHHSPTFRDLYRPAYRVVAVALLQAEVVAAG